MKIPATLTLNGAVVAVELNVSDELLAGRASEPDSIDDRQLRERWGVSGRTTKRLRDGKRLPYIQPTQRTFRYRLSDIREYEVARLKRRPGAENTSRPVSAGRIAETRVTRRRDDTTNPKGGK